MKPLLIIGIITLVILAGCETTGNNNTSATPPTFMGGSEGITAEFSQMGIETDGIDTVWEGETFPVELRFINKGETDVDPAELVVELRGIDTNLFNIPVSVMSNSAKLERVSELNPAGGEETIAFPNGVLQSVTGLFYDADFFAYYTYNYNTKIAVPKVCFKEDYRDDSLCLLSEEKEAFASGAPISITKVAQEPSGSGSIALLFEIQNVGDGDVTVPGQTFSPLYDQIQFDLKEGNTQGIIFTCKSAGSQNVARFNEAGMSQIRCTTNAMPTGTLFTSQVTMELSYDYRDVIQKTVRIKDVP